MRLWCVLEHPTRPCRFVPQGFSWGFFFLGSLWAMFKGHWGLLGWWLLLGACSAVIVSLDPPLLWKFVLGVVSLFFRVRFCEWFWPKKRQDLIDRGWQQKAVLEGPTEEFVQAAWHRGKGR